MFGDKSKSTFQEGDQIFISRLSILSLLVIQVFGSVPLKKAQLKKGTSVQRGPKSLPHAAVVMVCAYREDLKCSMQAKRDFNSRQ